MACGVQYFKFKVIGMKSSEKGGSHPYRKGVRNDPFNAFNSICDLKKNKKKLNLSFLIF